MSNSVISFIIVNFNGKEHLKDCFNTIFNQNYPKDKIEIIMVDNGSEDGSIDYVEKNFPTIRIIRNSTNEGFAKPNNDAAKIAKGKYLALINNDMRLDKNWLNEMIDTLEKAKTEDEKYVCVGSKILNWDGTKLDFAGGSINFYGHGYQYDFGIDIKEANKKYNEDRDILFACGGAMLIEKDIFLNIGGFDEDYFAYFEDVDLGWRLWILGYKVKFCSKSICYHKHNSTSKKLNRFKLNIMYNRNSLYTIYKNYEDDKVFKVITSAILLKVYKGNKFFFDNKEEDLKENEGKVQYYAIQEFLNNLDLYSKKRKFIQGNRVISDKEIFEKFVDFPYKNLMVPNTDLSYFETIENLIAGINLDVSFGEFKKNVLIISNDYVGKKMAGPGIRYWEFAKQMSKNHNVTLAIPNDIDLDVQSYNFDVKKYCLSEPNNIVELAINSDVILIHGFMLENIRILKEISKNKILIVDIYDPFVIENLEIHRKKSFKQRNEIHNHDLKVQIEQLKLGDYFICASEKQKDFWIGMLSSLNKINPEEYDLSSKLEKLVGLVPFGISDEEPRKTRDAMKEKISNLKQDDKVLIWGGGVWNWFDPLTLIEAVHILSKERNDIKLFFMGVKHPNPAVPEMEMTNKAIELAEKLGLKDKYVFFNMDWVDYEDRQNFLLESHLGVSCHFNHLETRFSFRTRILDCLWARLPIIATEGDYFAEEIQKNSLGIVVEYENSRNLVDAIRKLSDDKKFYNECKKNIDQYRENYKWDIVTKPLNDFCNKPVKKKLQPISDDYHLIYDIKQESKNTVVGEILDGDRVGQKFRCRYPNLKAIDIFVATYARVNEHKLKFKLFEATTKELLFEKDLNAVNLKDNSWYKIDLRPIINSEGREFYFYLESEGAGLGNAITLWQNSDINTYGNIWRNDNLVQGNLVFRTHCVYNEEPLKEEEGIVIQNRTIDDIVIKSEINSLDSIEDLAKKAIEIKNNRHRLRDENHKVVAQLQNQMQDVITNINNINNWITTINMKLKKIKSLGLYGFVKKLIKR
ncbi:glycosyltransferase [Clostridiaceae bacterium 35-E11]